MRKVFLENIPKLKKYKNPRIDWINSIGSRAKFIYDDIEGYVEIIDYDYINARLTVKYNETIQTIGTQAFIDCNFGSIVGKCTKKYIYEKGCIVNNLKIIECIRVKHDNNSTEKGYKYECCDCGHKSTVPETRLKNGMQCPVCKGTHKICVKEINSIWKTHPHLVDYFVNIEDSFKNTHSSIEKALLRCPQCNNERKMIIGNLTFQGFSCPKCGDGISYPEKFIFSILEQLGIKFQTQLNKTNFKWCDSYKYDFYIPSFNVVIEAHGLQHYEYTGWGRTIEEEQENDRFKKALALKNGIKEENYVVINCRESNVEFIKKNILESRLNELFDLNDINWLKCEEFAMSNRVKEACELKRNNPEMTTVEIGEIMKLNRTTIKDYLKRGSKIWDWVNYDPKEEKIKSAIKCGKRNGKAILCYKDNNLLGKFDSACHLQNISEELFGVKLYQSRIRECCINENKNHKGYTFKYVEGD